jgi:hypothetical protein
MMKTRRARADRGVTTVEWVIVAMIIGVGGIAMFRTFKDSYMQPAAQRMGDCIEAAAGDGNLCGGLGNGAASSGAGPNGGGPNGAGGNGAVASNTPAPGGNANGGGMTAGELADSVGNGHGAPGAHGGENPNADTVNRIGYGMGLAAAGEDALIDVTIARTGIELTPAWERAIGAVRAGEGALIGVPLDVIANGVPRNSNDIASLGAKTAIIGAAGWFGGPVGAVAAVGLDKSIGYVADSMTGGSRYAGDYEDSIAWRMVHGVPGTAGKEGMEQAEANRQALVHDQLDYMRQQQQRDAEALREMMTGHP